MKGYGFSSGYGMVGGWGAGTMFPLSGIFGLLILALVILAMVWFVRANPSSTRTNNA